LIAPQPRKLLGPNLYLPVRRKPGRITGRVLDEAGNPVVGARVSIAGVLDTTDPAGHFEITIPGDHIQSDLVLQAMAKGYATWRGSVVLGSNEVTVPLSRP
jgi:hypothetical protein